MIDQQRRLLDPDKSVRDILADGGDWVDVRGHTKHVQGYLKEFLFDPGAWSTRRSARLSGGERSRLLLAREFARRSNLLVLDEPTNDLDLETLDLLQEVIADYDGTVLIVSHDRDFLDRTVTITLGLDGSGKVDIVAGGYEDWISKRRRAEGRRSRRPRPPATLGAAAAPQAPDQADLQGPARLRPPPRPDRGARRRQIARDEEALHDPDLYTRDPTRFAALTAAIDKARAERDAAEERWLELAERLEALAG